MSDSPTPSIGAIAWHDLTVADAAAVRDFYAAVVGWTHAATPMNGYDDYCMNDAEGQTVAGVCHARGVNAGIPPQWLIYITVESVDRSAAACTRLGGEIVLAPRELMGGRFCIIRDPAGAVCALWQSPPTQP